MRTRRCEAVPNGATGTLRFPVRVCCALLAVMLMTVGCAGGDSGVQEAGGGAGVPSGEAASGGGVDASVQSTDVRGRMVPAAGDSVPVAVLAGTSLTAGLGLAPSDAYPAVLQRMADSAGVAVRVENRGLSGETSAGLVRRLPWVLSQGADVVLIETGANDGLRGLQVDSTRANLVRAVQVVRDSLPDAEVLLVQMEAPPNLGEQYTSAFRAMYGEVAGEMGVRLVPFLLEGVAGEAGMNQADGIHPNEVGAVRVAETVWPVFVDAVREVGRMVAEGAEIR